MIDQHEAPFKKPQTLQAIRWENYTTLNSNNTKCDPEWSTVNLTTGQFCYFFDFTLASRNEAINACRKMGATLPLPGSPADDRILKKLFPTTGRMSQLKLGSSYGVWIDAVFKEMGYYLISGAMN